MPNVVFFSFTERNRHTVARIKGRAMNSRYKHLNFKVKDLLKRWDTIDKTVIRQAIAKSIYGTSRTIVFVGNTTYRSRWVPVEVQMTLARNKPVYAIRLKGTVGRKPDILIKNGIRLHAWSETTLQRLATI
jgi:hypothetical protein